MNPRFEAAADTLFLGFKSFLDRVLEKRLAPIEERLAAPPQVVKGDPGERGAEGPQGPQGPTGERGADGAAGNDGKPGETGPQGAAGGAGDVGPQGAPGEPGAAGERGNEGPQGKAGADGINGRDGASAFDIAKASGFVGSEGEWLLSLRGADGIRGKDGRDGQDGQHGRDGANGERGRDAIDIAATIVEGIDSTRSYPQGTAIAMRGGLFIARRATDPIDGGDYRAAGWVCVLSGIEAEAEAIEDGGRIVVKTVRYSDGSEAEIRRKTAAIVHRGVYEGGREYEAGDAVTYGGSVFVAQKSTTQPPRGDPSQWVLAVKRGKDGRDPS